LSDDLLSEGSEISMDEATVNMTTSANSQSTATSSNPSAQLNSQSSGSRKVHYERVQPEDLQKSHSYLNWTRLLRQMERVSGSQINKILVESNEHLVQVGQLIERHSRRTVENYLCWATVARFLPYLGSHFRRLYADFRRKVPDLSQNTDAPLEFANPLNQKVASAHVRKQKANGFSVRRSGRSELLRKSGSGSGRLFLSRWKECVHLTTEGLKSASAVLYVQQRQQLVDSVSQHVSRLVERLQQAFDRIVDSQSWLDTDEVRRGIKRRASDIRSRIALPVGLLRSADEALADLQIEVHAVFVANIVAMLRHEMTNELKRLSQIPDSERDWMMEPLVPNAYYDSLNHFISMHSIIRFRNS
jgi:predicted metalloendopeptidase